MTRDKSASFAEALQAAGWTETSPFEWAKDHWSIVFDTSAWIEPSTHGRRTQDVAVPAEPAKFAWTVSLIEYMLNLEDSLASATPLSTLFDAEPHLLLSSYLLAIRDFNLVDEVAKCLHSEPDAGIGRDVLGELVAYLPLERRSATVQSMPTALVSDGLLERVKWLDFCDAPGQDIASCPLGETELVGSPDWVQRRLVSLETTPLWLLELLGREGRTRRVRNAAEAACVADE